MGTLSFGSERMAEGWRAGLVAASLFVAGCRASGATPMSSEIDFPLAGGNSWEFSSARYEVLSGQASTAVYSLVDTIISTGQRSEYWVFEVDRKETLLSSEGSWTEPTSQHSTFWYLVRDSSVYQLQTLESITEPSAVHLIYPFPLHEGKAWCPTEGFPLDKCFSSGRRTATAIETFRTAAGTFGDCYSITEDFTTGTFSEVFCAQVGIVQAKFDHNGAPFGFENTLVSYNISQH